MQHATGNSDSGDLCRQVLLVDHRRAPEDELSGELRQVLGPLPPKDFVILGLRLPPGEDWPLKDRPEGGAVPHHARVHEVDHGMELPEIVLDRGPRQEDSAPGRQRGHSLGSVEGMRGGGIGPELRQRERFQNPQQQIPRGGASTPTGQDCAGIGGPLWSQGWLPTLPHGPWCWPAGSCMSWWGNTGRHLRGLDLGIFQSVALIADDEIDTGNLHQALYVLP